MKRKLEMDDIRIGMYITILKGEREERVIPGPRGPIVISKEKRHYNGKVLEVIALELPYIAIAIHSPVRGSLNRNDTIDLRIVEVIALTSEYIHKMLPDLEITKDFFWEDVLDTSLEEADTTIEEIFKHL